MAWEGFRRLGLRGASALAPANTLASFDAAVAVGIDTVEFDVREWRGELVLAHTIFHAARGGDVQLGDALAHLAGYSGFSRRVITPLQKSVQLVRLIGVQPAGSWSLRVARTTLRLHKSPEPASACCVGVLVRLRAGEPPPRSRLRRRRLLPARRLRSGCRR
jgi:hypothetical protein